MNWSQHCNNPLRFKNCALPSGSNYQDYGRQVIADLADHLLPGWQIDPENEEGIRINLTGPYGQGWFLLRMSLHEPLLFKGDWNDEAGHLPAVVQAIGRFLSQYEAIDQSKLTQLLVQQPKFEEKQELKWWFWCCWSWQWHMVNFSCFVTWTNDQNWCRWTVIDVIRCQHECAFRWDLIVYR